MTTFQSKLDAEREAKANRLGLPLWAYDMATAVDDQLMADLRADAGRSSPTTPTPALPSEPPRTQYAEFPEDLCDVIRAAGGNINRCPAHVIREAQRLLVEGCSVGAAGARVFKLFRDQL